MKKILSLLAGLLALAGCLNLGGIGVTIGRRGIIIVKIIVKLIVHIQ